MSKIKEYKPGKPIQLDLVIKRNDDFIIRFRGWNEDGSAYDFTDHTFRLQVKKTEDATTTEINVTNDDFTITQDSIGSDDGVQNIISINHDKANIDTAFKNYYWDLEMTDASGNVFTTHEGRFSVTKDTTNVS